jgi:hypothetical protein
MPHNRQGQVVLNMQTGPQPVLADGPTFQLETMKKRSTSPTRQSTSLTVQSWMSPEIGEAWRQGYTGRGATVTVIDDFRSGSRFYGDLRLGTQLLRHGEWTRQEASMLAPGATMRSHDFLSGSHVPLNRGLNVANLSYGMFAPSGFSPSQIQWSAQESSLIAYARDAAPSSQRRPATTRWPWARRTARAVRTN